MFQVKINNGLRETMWYHNKPGEVFYVKNYDDDFYRIPRTNKLILKTECSRVVEKTRKQPIVPEERFINDGFKNASDALSKLGVFEFKKRYRKRVLS